MFKSKTGRIIVIVILAIIALSIIFHTFGVLKSIAWIGFFGWSIGIVGAAVQKFVDKDYWDLLFLVVGGLISIYFAFCFASIISGI